MLKVHLLGTVGADPELRYSPSGQVFLRMTVACNYRAKGEAGAGNGRPAVPDAPGELEGSPF